MTINNHAANTVTFSGGATASAFRRLLLALTVLPGRSVLSAKSLWLLLSASAGAGGGRPSLGTVLCLFCSGGSSAASCRQALVRGLFAPAKFSSFPRFLVGDRGTLPLCDLAGSSAGCTPRALGPLLGVFAGFLLSRV